MINSCLGAELLPHLYRLIPRLSYVLRHVGLLIAKALCPPMLVLFAHALAIGVMVIGSEVERIDSTRTTMDEGIRQSPGSCVVETNHE